MKRHIRILSLVLAIVTTVLCFSSCLGKKDSEKDLEKDSGKLTSTNNLKEDTKYFFEYAELDISFDSYFHYKDDMTKEKYESFCKKIEEECQQEMKEDALKHVFYIKKEDGTYVKQSADFYIFSGGNFFQIWLEGIGEESVSGSNRVGSIGTYEGSDVYYGYKDLWDELGGAEAFLKASSGTYSGNEITFVGLKEYSASVSGGKLKVVERYEGSYGIDYICNYTYYYTPQK